MGRWFSAMLRRYTLKSSRMRSPGKAYLSFRSFLAGARGHTSVFCFSRAGVSGQTGGLWHDGIEQYNNLHYHRPSDEYHDDWDFGSMAQMAQFALRLGMDVANTPKLPTWNAGDEFLKARQASGVQ